MGYVEEEKSRQSDIKNLSEDLRDKEIPSPRKKVDEFVQEGCFKQKKNDEV